MLKTIRISVIAMLAVGTASVANAETLRLATEGAYPPFNYVDNTNKPKGMDVDIANAVCERMNVQCTIAAQEWDGIIPALLSKKYDAVVASMVVTEDRKKIVNFTNRYYMTHLAMAVPKGSDIKSSSPEALKGKIVGAQSSSTQGVYAQDIYEKAGAEVKLYGNQEDANRDLINGRLDAVVSDKYPLRIWMKDTGAECCESLGDISDTAADVAIAVRKEDTALLERFNAALAEIMADGTYQKITSKYFDININQ